MKGQSSFASLMETIFSVASGFFIALGATYLICRFYNIPITHENNFIITGWMTVISIVRGYIVRRLWNSEFWKHFKMDFLVPLVASWTILVTIYYSYYQFVKQL